MRFYTEYAYSDCSLLLLERNPSFGNLVRHLQTHSAVLPTFKDLRLDVQNFILHKLSSLLATDDRTLTSVGLPKLSAASQAEIEDQLQIVNLFYIDYYHITHFHLSMTQNAHITDRIDEIISCYDKLNDGQRLVALARFHFKKEAFLIEAYSGKQSLSSTLNSIHQIP